MEGTSAPTAFQNGTGGNFAARAETHPSRFVVTSRGAHKGKLQLKDFVEIVRVDWEGKKIYVCRDNARVFPSTDSLLVAIVFEMSPQLNGWVHFHKAVDTPYTIKLQYPAQAQDREKLAQTIGLGAHTVNMIDHNLFIKKEPDNTADSAIIVGMDLSDAFERAITLIQSA